MNHTHERFRKWLDTTFNGGLPSDDQWEEIIQEEETEATQIETEEVYQECGEIPHAVWGLPADEQELQEGGACQQLQEGGGYQQLDERQQWKNFNDPQHVVFIFTSTLLTLMHTL